MSLRRWAWLLLAMLPVLVHLPAWSGWFRFDPIYVVSGLTPGTWTTNGLLPGYPWIDGNAGVTTEALGGLAAHDWLTGRLPWWNPYSGVGLPLAAEGQNPAFFLPFVLSLALPHGLLALRMVLMALAGMFSFALLRRLRLGTMPSLVGATLFELNGSFAWLAHGPIMPVAFLPLLLLGLEQAQKRFSIAVVLGVAWSLAAGFPETACLDLMFAGVWGAVRLAQAPDRRVYAMRVGVGVLSGAMLAAPAVWPFLEALPREFVGSHAGVVASGFRPANLALLLFPGMFGAPMAAPITLGASDAMWVRAGGYCDLVLVALAVAAIRLRARDRALRFAMLGWIVVTAARAWHVPVAVWAFSLVPLLRQANVHLYVLPSWSMGLAILAGFALQDWRDGGLLHWRRAALPLAALVTFAMVFAWPDVRDLWVRLAGYAPMLLVSLAVPVLVTAAVVAMLGKPAGNRRQAVLGVAVIGNAALLFVLPQLAGTHGRRVDVGAIRYLQDNVGLGRVLSLGPLVPNYGALYGIAEIGHNYLPVPAEWVDYVRTRLMPGSDGVNFHFGAAPDTRVLTAMLPAYQQAGVSLVAVQPGTEPFDIRQLGAPVLAYRGAAMDIWRLPDAAPYFQASGCTLAPSSREDVVVQCNEPATLRRLELFWPGWSARVDGRAAPVSQDSGVFQSVNLPAGVSQVAFAYAPPGMNYAWASCVTGLCLLVAASSARALPRTPLVR